MTDVSDHHPLKTARGLNHDKVNKMGLMDEIR